MSKSPKFMVFHLKELIYTFILIVLGIALIITLVLMFSKDTTTSAPASDCTYKAGVYSSYITLNGNPMEIQVVLDDNHINSITIENIDDSVATMYPLVKPAFEDIANQIVSTQSLENVSYNPESQYTYSVLSGPPARRCPASGCRPARSAGHPAHRSATCAAGTDRRRCSR